jgi:hypothetical protein
MLEAGHAPFSSEGMAVRSLMNLETLNAAAAHLRTLAPVIQQLHAREPVPRFVKPTRHFDEHVVRGEGRR